MRATLIALIGVVMLWLLVIGPVVEALDSFSLEPTTEVTG